MDSLNRRLIRPNLSPPKEQPNHRRIQKPRMSPPEQTHAETFYYLKQMQGRTPMIFVLGDGETLQGVIEWYDKTCLKVNREGAPNLLIFKPNIKYMYKASAD